ncbi:MAG: PKD domain-containing protein [Bacteroidota bacterium]
MFQSSGYIKLLLSISFFVLLNIISNKAYAQCSALTNNVSIDFQVDGQCAPVDVTTFEVTYNFSVSQNPNDVEIIIEWNDPGNNSDIFSVANGNLTVLSNNVANDRFQAVGSFSYPQNNDCRFEPIASIRVNGSACAGSTQPQTVNSWSEDNNFGGVLAINPNEFNVCEGDGFSNIRFADASEFNCRIGVEPDDPNRQPRHVQFIYGTNHNAANGIKNLTIEDGGAVNLTDAGGALNGTSTLNGITATYFGPIDEIPFPADAPNSETFPFSLADNPANIENNYFEVTMVNWNTCNPYNGNPASPNYGDAIIETARIVVVGDPTTTIEFRNQNNTITSNFCPGDEIRLRQDGATIGGTGNFEYRWEVFDGNNDTDPIIYSSAFDNNIDRNINSATTNGFSGGTKLVRLHIEDQDAEGNCVNTVDELITITSAPTATIDFDYEGNTGTGAQEQICFEEFSSNQLILNSSNTVDNSGNGFSTEWELFRKRENIADFPASPDSTFSLANSSITLNLTSAGVYRARLIAEDDITGCSTFDDFTFVINDQPVAEFSTNDVCEGEDVNFDPANSEIPIIIEGDAITLYEWDFSYASTDGFQVENSETNNSDFDYNLGAPGNYNVALRVLTDDGCVSEIYEQSVEVKHNPQSNLAASYTNDYNGNLAGDAYSGDPICPGTLLTFTNTTDESLNDTSVDPVDYELQIDSLGFTVYRDIDEPGGTDDSVSPNIFFNNTGSNVNYTIQLAANGDNGCEVLSSPIVVTVLPGDGSGFEVFDESTYTDSYDPLVDYCSPSEFFFQIDNPTDNLLDPGDSLVWEVYDGSTLLGGDTIEFSDPDYDKFSFEFFNDYPSIAAINYTIVLQPYVDGVCVNNSQRTVRVLPKPSSDFNPIDTVVTCDSVTYYFEAEQPGLLDYDWQVQTIADTLSTQNDGIDFWVSYARPDIGDPNVNVEVRLQTENPFNCQSDLSDPFNDTITSKDDIEIVLDTVGNEFCAPTVFGFVNKTTDSIPAGTEWELIIKNLDLNDSTIIDGENITGNTEFRDSTVNIFEYEFTDSANYEIRLNALLPSTCDVASDPPISIGINETPQVNFTTNRSEGCSPLSIDLIETSTSPSGNDFFISYEVINTLDASVVETSSQILGPGGQFNGESLSDLVNTTEPFIDYDIVMTAESLSGCISDSTVTVRVFQEPQIDFDIISPNPACQEDYNFQFEITTNDVPAGTEYTWNWDDGQSLLTDQDTAVNHEFSNRASFFGSDSYTVTLTAETPDNCSNSISKTVNLNPRLQAKFNASQEEGCDPYNVTFTSSSLGTSITGPGNHEYLRRLKGETTWNAFNGSISNTGTVNELFENNTDSTQIWEILYTVESDLGGCRDTADIKEIAVFSSPDFDVNVIESPLCQIDENGDYEFEFELDNIEIPAGTEFTWNWGDGSTPFVTTSTANQSHIFENRLSYFGTDNYTVTVTAETDSSCVLNKTVDIQLFPQIEALFFQNKDEGCSPLEVNFSSSSRGTGLTGNYIYQRRIQGSSTWNTISGGETNGSTSDIFENTTGSDIVYEIRQIVSSDVGNCADTSEISEILVFPEFSTPKMTGPTEVCTFQQEVVYSIPHTLGSTYDWQLPTGAFISGQNANGNQVRINFSSFSGDVQVTEIDDNGCRGEPSIIPVSVLSGPSVTLSLNGPNTICPGDETSLIFDLQGEGSQGFDVIYSNGEENDTLQNINDGHIETITPTESRNYFVLDVIDREYPNCNAASVSGNAFVNVNFAPTASISGDATICEDESTNLFINLTGAGPWEVVYTDQSSNYTIEDINSPVYQLEVSPEENTNYELVSVTDSNTPVCSGTVEGSATVDINPKPTANIFGNFDDICANENIELGIELTGYAPWTVRYTDGNNTFTIPNITPPAGHDPENDTYVHNFEVFPNTGTTNYTLVDVRDSNTPNCTGEISGTAVVTSYDRPQVEIEGSNTICLGDNSPITFNFTGDGPFDVIMTANQDTLEYNNLQNKQSVNLSPEESTVYRVVELTDNRTCSGNSLGSPVSINVNNLPTSEISGNDVICNGDETELVFDQSGVGPWTITYTDGDQNYTFTTSFNRHFEPVTPTSTTTYTLVSVVDSNSPESCTGTVSGSALKEVFPELEASFEVSPEEMVLPESTVSINNTTSNKNEWEYEWDFGDGTTSTEVDPAPHEYGNFGTFVIRMTATNGQCTDTYQTSVTIGAIPPIVDFDASPKEGCLPLVVEFENLTQFADPATYQWEFGDGQRVSAVENPTHVYRNPGTYTVRLTASNITGQRTEMVKEEFIVVNETPEASFTIPDEYRQVFTTEEVRFVNLSEGADEFIWKFGDGNESFEAEPIHAYPDSGIYDITLIAINSETGCSDSMTLSSQVQVILGGTSETPNAFTPSRAGPGSGSSNPNQNDFFLPKVEGVSQFNMKVYNRWGELLFESDDKTKGWDGYYNGVLMPQGVYVYRLELVYENGRRETKIGDITLIR